MESVLQPPPPFKFENNLINVTSGNLSKEWEKWKKSFMIYYEACELSKKEKRVQINILLHVIGEKCREVYDQFSTTRTLEELLAKFDDFFLPKKNLTVERHKFFTRDQRELESIEQYVFELNKMAAKCEFKELCDDLVRDRLICGLKDASLRERLLRESDLTLQKALEICRLAEMSRVQADHIKQDTAEHHIHEIQCHNRSTSGRSEPCSHGCCEPRAQNKECCVDAVSAGASGTRRRARGARRHRPTHDPQPTTSTDARRHRDDDRPRARRDDRPPTQNRSACSKCGVSHRRYECPAFGRRCNRCNKMNHYSRMCRIYTLEGNSTDQVTNKTHNSNDWHVRLNICNLYFWYGLPSPASGSIVEQ